MKDSITFKEFKELYRKAKAKGVETFFAGDFEFNTLYAKFLIESLEGLSGMTEETVLKLENVIQQKEDDEIDI